MYSSGEEESGCSWISQKWNNLSTSQKAGIGTTAAIIAAGTLVIIGAGTALCATGSLAICAAKGLQTTTASPLFSEPPASILGQPIDPHQIDGAEEMLTESRKRFGQDASQETKKAASQKNRHKGAKKKSKKTHQTTKNLGQRVDLPSKNTTPPPLFSKTSPPIPSQPIDSHNIGSAKETTYQTTKDRGQSVDQHPPNQFDDYFENNGQRYSFPEDNPLAINDKSQWSHRSTYDLDTFVQKAGGSLWLWCNSFPHQVSSGSKLQHAINSCQDTGKPQSSQSAGTVGNPKISEDRYQFPKDNPLVINDKTKWIHRSKEDLDNFVKKAGDSLWLWCHTRPVLIISGDHLYRGIRACENIHQQNESDQHNNTHNSLDKKTKKHIKEIIARYTESGQSALTSLTEQPDDSQLASFCQTPGERAAVEIYLRKQCPLPSGMSQKKINYEKGLRLAISTRRDLTRFCGGESELNQFLKEYGTNCQTVTPKRSALDQKLVAMAIEKGVTHAETFAMAAKDWASSYGASDPSVCVTDAASDIISYISRRSCSQELRTVTVESPSRLEGKEGLHITVENVPVFLKESMQEMSRILETLVKGSKTMPDGFAMTIKIENVGPYDLQNIASAGPDSTYEGTAITKTCSMNLSTDFVLGGVMKKKLDRKATEPLDTLVHEGLHCLFDWNSLGVLDENGEVVVTPYNKALQPMLQKFKYTNDTFLYLLISEPCKQYMQQLKKDNPNFSNLYQENDPRIGYEGMPTTGNDHTSRAMLRIAPPNALQYGGANVLDGSIKCIAVSLRYELKEEDFAAAYPDLFVQNPHKPYNATFDYLGALSH